MSIVDTDTSISITQLESELLACLRAGLTPFITSSPGMGKSASVKSFAEKYKLFLIDFRLGQALPEDLNGFPMRTEDGKATFVPFDTFPLEDTPIPAGYQGFLIFLDEANAATKPVQAAAYKLILDRMVGTRKLHPNTFIVAAGNKASDKAVVNTISTALQSRMIHYTLEMPAAEFQEYTIKENFDPRITAFLYFAPQRIMDFRPDHHDRTYACPRTWEFLSRLIRNEPEINMSLMPRIAGTVGAGVALEFITFAREYASLPKLDDIVKAPHAVPLPVENSAKYACILMLADSIVAANAKPVLEYVDSFEPEFRVLFMKVATARNESLRFSVPEFVDFMRRISRFVTELAA